MAKDDSGSVCDARMQHILACVQGGRFPHLPFFDGMAWRTEGWLRLVMPLLAQNPEGCDRNGLGIHGQCAAADLVLAHRRCSQGGGREGWKEGSDQ